MSKTTLLSKAVMLVVGLILASSSYGCEFEPGRYDTPTSEPPTSTITDTPQPTETPTLTPNNTVIPSETFTETPTVSTGLIAFASNRAGNFDIYTIKSDGSDVTQLTHSSTDELMPTWSPEGSRIAFVAGDAGDSQIYVIDANGSNKTNLTNKPGTYNCFPTWSPDGKHIAFNSTRDGNFEVYVMNADGSNQINLTNYSGMDRMVSWSPDGTKLAFYSERYGNADLDVDAEIYVMNSDGSHQMALTNNKFLDAGPAWSPDGKRIAFYSTRDGSYNIYIMNADGSTVFRVTQDSGPEYQPNWSPDGKKLAFYRLIDGNNEIYTVNVDGSGLLRLTNDRSNDMEPVWAPSETFTETPTVEPVAQIACNNSYWPISLNAHWIYQSTIHNAQTGNDTSGTEEWTITSLNIFDATNADFTVTIQQSDNSTNSVNYTCDETGIYQVTGDYKRFVLPEESRLFAGNRLGDMHTVGELDIEGFESINVPAGNYNAIWISSLGAGAEYYFYAEGVGMVKYSRVDTVDTGNSVDLELALHYPSDTPLPTPTAVPQSSMQMVSVPEGNFTMGDNANHGMAECQKYYNQCDRTWFIYEEPAHQVYLNAFMIDETEVTGTMYSQCVQVGVCPNDNTSSGSYPAVNVTWNDAQTYCNWAGKRLPTEAEWEKAARGTDARIYPWGNNAPNCSLANFTSGGSGTCVGGISSVFDQPGGASPYGALNMAGNVWEWVADWFSQTYYSNSPQSNPTGPSSGTYRVMRGGSFTNIEVYMDTALRAWNKPTIATNWLGFRCAK